MEDFFYAVSTGDLNILRAALRSGADVNEPGRHLWTPLHFAVIQDKLEIVWVYG